MKPTGLKALLPELNEAQYKLLERWVAEQRIAELYKGVPYLENTQAAKDYFVERVAQLKKEAGL